VTAPVGFDFEAHERWVAEGYCPYVEGKTWCNGWAGHGVNHWAPFLLPDGSRRNIYLHRAILPERPEGSAA
jgi:hypothetical protein